MKLSRIPKLAGKAMALLTSGAALTTASLRTPLRRASAAQRLAALPATGLPVAAPVEVRWNDHLVPFIEAQSDDDLAFAIGHVQAHLRLGQIGMMRRVATGRLAESFGPLAIGVDVGLRMLGFGEAAGRVAAALPANTRRWVQRYCDGLNHYQSTVPTLPHDVQVLNLGREPFTVEDVITMGRLAGNDINWLGWAGLMRYRKRPDWKELWAQSVHYGGNSRASFVEADTVVEEALDNILEGVGRTGSNAIAVAGSRTPHGSALMAGDPHVGIFLPSLWMALGIRSPSYHAVGLMIPGVPFLAIGRNAEIGWGATNMRAASSDLVSVGALPEREIETREQVIKVRWGRPRRINVRRTGFGPIVSDAPIFPKGAAGDVALRWMGHHITDEITAMLEVTKARDFASWRTALTSFGVSGQNFLYADRAGHIGQVMAVHLPARDPKPPADLILLPDESRGWDRPVTAADLPFAYDPPSGYLVSANNQPADAPVLLGYFFAANDRITRLKELVEGRHIWTMAELATLQRDVVRISAKRLCQRVLERTPRGLDQAAGALLNDLAAWDGSYDAARREPVLLEFLATEIAAAMAYELGPLRGSEAVLDILADRLATLPDHTAETLIAKASMAAAHRAVSIANWGELHRLKLYHVLANVPGIGRRYPRARPPVSGSTTTVMKTAHALVEGPHGVSFGANARHVFDLSDPDANWFAILGGQDGDPGSACAMDQLPLWQQGRYMRLPLQMATVRAEFRYVTRLEPAASAVAAAPAAAAG